jgi:hypothetical protein
MGTARLLLRGEMIAELIDVSPDMPWFEARFVEKDGFSEVASLSREERDLLDSADFDVAAWESVWERIRERGVTLALADGTHIDRDFAMHVYDDGTTRLGY